MPVPPGNVPPVLPPPGNVPREAELLFDVVLFCDRGGAAPTPPGPPANAVPANPTIDTTPIANKNLACSFPPECVCAHPQCLVGPLVVRGFVATRHNDHVAPGAAQR